MQKAPSVLLRIRVKIPVNGKLEFRYVEPVYHPLKGKNTKQKLKPLYALVNRKAEEHPEGIYALRYAGKYENVGADAEVAVLKFERKKRLLEAKAAGVEVVEDGLPSSVKDKFDQLIEAVTPAEKLKRDFKQKLEEYLGYASGKSRRTYLAYKLAVTRYHKVVGKTDDNPHGKQFLEDLTEDDLLDFIRLQQATTQNGTTVRNMVCNVKTFYLHYNLPWTLKKKDMPKAVEKTVRAYDGEDVLNLLRHATLEERELIWSFLWTGAREQEVSTAMWTSFDFHTHTFWVHEQRELRFKPKDNEESSEGIPVPPFLIELLQARRKRYPTTRIIFPTRRGKVDGHMLRIVKGIAFRAGLNCGFCKTQPRSKGTKVKSCKDHPVCKKWGLHKFRKTFVTFHHYTGVPLNTIRLWVRHSQLETTQSYLENILDLRRIERIKKHFKQLWAGDLSESTNNVAAA
jgi:integrase/recombinase XerD